MVAVALSIAGSDPSGGAGIQADLKTFQAHGVYGEAVISLLTVQNSEGVSHVEPVSERLIAAQLAALWGDIPPQAAKCGALPSEAAVRAVAAGFRNRACPLVVDPILRATSGYTFSARDLAESIITELVPIARLVTPNAEEAALLTGLEVQDVQGAERAAHALLAGGAQAVLVKGGHFAGEPIDLLVTREGLRLELPSTRIATAHTHGTGCTYSAAITAWLALGCELPEAVARAKAWLARVIAEPLGLGRARGPLNHFVPVRASGD